MNEGGKEAIRADDEVVSCSGFAACINVMELLPLYFP
jgi:hypothetical protein